MPASIRAGAHSGRLMAISIARICRVEPPDTDGAFQQITQAAPNAVAKTPAMATFLKGQPG